MPSRYIALNHDTYGEVWDHLHQRVVSRHDLIRDAEAEADWLNRKNDMTKIDTSAEAVERLRDERLTATGPALEAWSLLASLALDAIAADRDCLAARVAELEGALSEAVRCIGDGCEDEGDKILRAALAGSARNDG